jgi:hypothetical protein
MEDKALFESDWHRKGWHLFGVFDGCVSCSSPPPPHFIYPLVPFANGRVESRKGSYVIMRWLLSSPTMVLPASEIYRMSRLHLRAWLGAALGYASNLTKKLDAGTAGHEHRAMCALRSADADARISCRRRASRYHVCRC